MKTQIRNGNANAKATKSKAKDAIAVLMQDHVEARAMLRELSESTERAAGKRAKVLAEVGPALWVHMQIEEELFYPAFEAAGKTSDDEVRGFEARAEHQSAKAALARLESCDPASTEFRAMAKVVFDLIDHHVTEEEEEMFPRARKLLAKEDLAMLGEQLMELKQSLLRSGSFRRGVAGARNVRAPKRTATRARAMA